MIKNRVKNYQNHMKKIFQIVTKNRFFFEQKLLKCKFQQIIVEAKLNDLKNTNI